MRRSAPFLILLAAVLLAYGPALQNGFVWDDTALVLRDPLIRSPRLLVEGFRHFLFLDATAADFYRPLQRVVYTFDYALAGFTPWVFHLTSILVHAGAAMMLYVLGRRLLQGAASDENKLEFLSHEGTKARRHEEHKKETESLYFHAFVPSCLRVRFLVFAGIGINFRIRNQLPSLLAFAVALLWAMHPIHSSAVIYVAGLADPLAALLGFGGLALLLARRWVVAGLCLGAALFAKESGVFAIVIGLGFAWNITWKENATWRKRLTEFACVALPALLMVALYLGVRTTAEHLPAPSPAPIPFLTRPVIGLRAVAEYAGLLVAPVNLRMERDVRLATGMPGDLQTLAGALLLCAAGVWFWRSGRTTRACLLAALVGYLPVSNLFALNATVAEHWVYVPSAFLLLAAAATWAQRPPQNRSVQMLALGVIGIWVAALGCRTAWRCQDWRNQETFLHATINGGGDSSRMLGNLASLKLSKGDVEGAVSDLRAALVAKPNQPFAMLGLSSALIKKGEFAEARQWLERCEKSPLTRADALVQRAVLEFRESGADRVDLLHEAAQVNPRFWPIRKRYISHLIERGDMGAALQELRAVLEDQPFRAETWEMLGQAAEKIGDPVLAQSAYAEADLRDVWRGKKF